MNIVMVKNLSFYNYIIGDVSIMFDKIKVHPLIAYSRLEDLRAMKAALKYLKSYIDYKKPELKTFGDKDLWSAMDRLSKRITEREQDQKDGH